MYLDPLINLIAPPGKGLRGLGIDIDLNQIIGRGIDVVGAAISKQPSVYVSPDDPRYRAQPPQNVYTYAVNPNQTMTAQAKSPSGVGFNIDQKTLLLAAGAVLIFLVARGK